MNDKNLRLLEAPETATSTGHKRSFRGRCAKISLSCDFLVVGYENYGALTLRIQLVGARAFCALSDDGNIVRRVAWQMTGDRMFPRPAADRLRSS